MAPPLGTIQIPDTGFAPDEFGDEDFVLDMRVVEAVTPLVEMMCNTDDGCGSTCGGSACSTSSNDPA
ncbi:FxLD family lanthipeptide [Herbidospora sp. RD11066]